MGDNSVIYLNPWQAQNLGHRQKSQLQSSGKILFDPITQNYIKKLGEKLLSGVTTPHLPLHFYVVKNSDPNAFSSPGGYVGINTGIILFVQDEAQLAAVMAHESGHVIQKHIPRSIGFEDKLDTFSLMAAAGSAALTLVNPALGLSMLSADGADYQQQILDKDRTYESEADAIGGNILYHSGFDPYAMSELFQHLLQNSELYPATPNFLRNHPTDVQRLSMALLRANEFPHKHYLQNPYFFLIQARVRAETSTYDDIAKAFFKNEINSNTHSYKVAGQYGLALIAYKENAFYQANKLVHSLILKYPKQNLFYLLQSEIFTKQKDFKKAYKYFKHIHSNLKYYDLIKATLAYDAGYYLQAKSLFENLSFNYPNQPGILYYLAKTDNVLGYHKTALINFAKLLIDLHKCQTAVVILTRVPKVSGKNPYANAQARMLMIKIRKS